jgi:diguanylate cyclase (GGDEF)-like protein/PAS domain S-box-containing protein
MANVQDPEIYRTALDSLQTAVCLMDRERKIFFWNEGAERITGYHRHDAVGHGCQQNVLPHCDGRACKFCGAACPIARALLDGKPTYAQIDLRHREGHRIPVRMWAVPLRDSHGSVIGVAQSFDRDAKLTEQRQEQNLAVYGCLDDATGVPNRGFTEFHLQENLDSFAKYHLPFGIMLIEVENLDQFRSAYGREAGDAILRVTAQTMKNALRPSDFLGRWGEAQFLAILMNCPQAGVIAASERIRKLVGCAGLQWWGDNLFVSTLVTTASVQADDTISTLLDRARNSPKHDHAKQAKTGACGR